MTRYMDSSIQSLGAAQGKQLELLQQEVLRQREEVTWLWVFTVYFDKTQIAYLKDELETEKKRRL